MSSNRDWYSSVAVLAAINIAGFAAIRSIINASSRPSKASTSPLNTVPPPQYNLSPRNISAARAEFTALLGAAHVSTDTPSLVSLTSTAWSPFPTTTPPFILLSPHTTAEVSSILRICHTRRIPLIPHSGGTSLDGAIASTRGGALLSFQRMDRILAIHARDLDAVVQPAVRWMDLNVALEPSGLFLPVDPSPDAQIGGMVATNCSGTNAYRYGPMKAWTLGLTVVLADGTVVRTRHRPRKSSAGYDLTSLIVGSAGTLGVVTEATVKLAARPRNVCVAVVPFAGIGEAVDAVIEVVLGGGQLGAVELLDEIKMRGVNQGGMTGRQWREVPTLFLKFDGEEESVREQIDAVRKIAESHGCLGWECEKDPEKVEGLWKARKHALPSFLKMKRKPEDTFASSDVAVPISRMADLIVEMHRRSKESGLLASVIGHVGDGNFHFSVLYGEEEKEKAEALQKVSQKLAVEMEGTVTGEHGIGYLLRDALEMEVGEEAVGMMRRIKLALDPLCILNPDKIIRLEKGV